MLTNRGWLIGLGYAFVNLDFEDTSHNQVLFELIDNKLHIGALLSLNKNVTGLIHSDEMIYENGTEKLLVGATSAQLATTHQQYVLGSFSWEV
jgi:RecJ-like exonuclease